MSTRTLTAHAVREFFSRESSDQFLTLITISGANIVTPIRLADGFLQRLSETDEEVIYGVVSRGQQFVYLPLELDWADDEDGAPPRMNITIHNVTRRLTPMLRSLTGNPDVLIELIWGSAPDSVELQLQGFELTGYDYDAGVVTGELVVDALVHEPFPQHAFTPAIAPGLH